MGRIEIVKNGITHLDTDAVVNAANEGLWEGGGVCGVIFQAAGSRKLQAACNDIGGCPTGSAVITPAFDLDAKFIIHAVGPRWHGGRHGEADFLYGAYYKSLELAAEHDCKSIGFPLISAGIFGYPVDKAWEVAIRACNTFISEHPDYDLLIRFGVPNEDNRRIGQKVLNGSCVKEPTGITDKGSSEIELYHIYVRSGQSHYESFQYVASFADQQMASNYAKYLLQRKKYPRQGIYIAKQKTQCPILHEKDLDTIIAPYGEVLMQGGKKLDY